MSRYVCIHAHFYQPPRDNPWLGAITAQRSAHPFHDWNERITEECYAPNAVARVLDAEGLIVDLVNNYENLSFDVGPTLLGWLERHAPSVYAAILEADSASRARFSGHGSAIAQAYNHLIQPLANRRDKTTQILWGVRDFEHRFGREPEGMWLPEAAVDVESLEIMAELGLRFTVLAPHQAARFRSDRGEWYAAESVGGINPRSAYRVALPSGREIAAFFYDGPMSRAIAFGDLLGSGDRLAGRLREAFVADDEEPQLVHVATDGETFGHHHRFGEMALAYAVRLVSSDAGPRLTNYGEFLAAHPPCQEVEIVEGSSWSCAHGVERWRSACGCRTGGEPGWNQEWRAPLRSALDWLASELAMQFESGASSALHDLHSARDAYIGVLLGDQSHEAFLAAHGSSDLEGSDESRVWSWLESQRYAMFMFTSCGWFFSDLAGIETVQVLRYAARAMQLAHAAGGDDLEPEFLDRLETARSNRPERGSGAEIYRRQVMPDVIGLREVAADYAILSLFEPVDDLCVYSLRAAAVGRVSVEQGVLVHGRLDVIDRRTRAAAAFRFAATFRGDQEVSCRVAPIDEAEEGSDDPALAEVARLWQQGDSDAADRVMVRALPGPIYDLEDVFPDARQRLLESLLARSLTEVEAAYRRIYERFEPRRAELGVNEAAFAEPIRLAAQFVVRSDLRAELAAAEPDVDRLEALRGQALEWAVDLDDRSITVPVSEAVARRVIAWRQTPDDPKAAHELHRIAAFARLVGGSINLWKAQNEFFRAVVDLVPAKLAAARDGDEGAAECLEAIRETGRLLSVRTG